MRKGFFVCFWALALAGVLSGRAPAGGDAPRVIPGQRIGQFWLGKDANQLKTMGIPDASDAAMNHAWSTWYARPNSRLDDVRIYAGLDAYVVAAPGGDGKKKILRELRTTSKIVETPKQVRVGDSFTEIKRKYSHIKFLKTYPSKSLHGAVAIYDDVKQGIAFEFFGETKDKTDARHCVAITIHPPGNGVEKEYMPLSDYLKNSVETENSPRK